MSSFGAGLAAMGLQKGDKVSLFSENSSRWLIADQGVMLNGAVDAVRGSTTPVEEQAYILQSSHSVGLIIQDAASLERLLPHINAFNQRSADGTHGSHEQDTGKEQVRENDVWNVGHCRRRQA